jgi:hypothetical protein
MNSFETTWENTWSIVLAAGEGSRLHTVEHRTTRNGTDPTVVKGFR